MIFYAIPPTGFIHMEDMIDLGRKRLQFFEVLRDLHVEPFHESTNFEAFHERLYEYHHLSESVMEGTWNDETAFFLLQCVVAHSHSLDLPEFIIQGEENLFRYRLQISDELPEMLSNLSKDLHLLYEGDGDMCRLAQVLSTMSKPYTCIHIPFQSVSPLVSRRKVELRHGKALIVKNIEKDYLFCVFQDLRRRGVHRLRRASCDDPRLSYITQSLIHFFHKNIRPKIVRTPFSSQEDVRNMSAHFPPCFQRLYANLRRDNRLKHDARVSFTLFLKEIGVSMHDAIQFWSEYYSKEGKGSCTHSWQKDEQKFIYSIKHSYGQEGSRRNYSAHKCLTIQNNSFNGPNEQLVCPFTDEELSTHVQDIEDLVRANQPSKACEKHFSHLRKVSISMNILKPSEYFLLAYNHKCS